MVEVRYGRSRTVVLLPWAGVVLKIAWRSKRVRAERRALRQKLWGEFLHEFPRAWKLISYKLQDPSIDLSYFVRHAVRRYVEYGWGTTFQVVLDNVRERRFYRQSGPLVRMLLAPTYCSFFGLVNIVRYAEPTVADWRVVSFWFYEHTQGDSGRDTHHFQNPANFTGMEDGWLKVLDYAEPAVQRILNEHALALLGRVDLVKAAAAYATMVADLDDSKNKKAAP